IQVKLWVLVPREAHETGFALLLGSAQRFENAALGVCQFRVVVKGHGVNLPQVKVVGLEPAQRLLQHFHGEIGTPSVSANLGHEKSLFAAPLQRSTHPVFSAAIPIFPAVVAKSDAGVEGLMNEPNGLG